MAFDLTADIWRRLREVGEDPRAVCDVLGLTRAELEALLKCAQLSARESEAASRLLEALLQAEPSDAATPVSERGSSEQGQRWSHRQRVNDRAAATATTAVDRGRNVKGAMTDVLAGNHAHVRYFRACFDLGKAIEPHLDELNLALLGEQDGEPLTHFLEDCSRRWLDDHVKQLAKLDYDDSIEFIRARIRADLPVAPPPRATVCEHIAAALTATPPHELDRYLHAENERAHSMAGRATDALGGPRAAARGQSRNCATLDYREVSDVTRYSFEFRDAEPVIVVHIGKHSDAASHPRRGSLRLRFCFLFFCFHEYLSHAFSLWGRRDFVDGYLFLVARQLFPKLTAGIMQHTFVDETFAQHDSPSLQGIDAIARWIDNVTPGDSFVRFLIAWAAEPVADDFDATLDALHYFRRNQPDTGSIVRLCTILEERDHATVRAGLRALARHSGNLPPNYTPTL